MTSDKETTVKHNINILLTVFAKATSPLHPLPSPLEQELPSAAAACAEREISSPRREHGTAPASSTPPAPQGSLGAGTASWAPSARVVAAAFPQPLAEAAGADTPGEVPRSADSPLPPRRSLFVFSLGGVDAHKIPVLFLSWGFSPVGLTACGKRDAWMGWPTRRSPEAVTAWGCPGTVSFQQAKSLARPHIQKSGLVLHRERWLEDKNLLSVQTHSFVSVFAL